jgi:hypothetical protein
MHPHGKLVVDIGCTGVHRCPELLKDSPLRALDLAINRHDVLGALMPC